MKIKHTFKNGLVVEGTTEQLLEISKALKEPLPAYYHSDSGGGPILIAEMPTTHLRGALLKETRKFYEHGNFATLNPKEFIDRYTSLSESRVISDLMNELIKRSKATTLWR